MKKKLLIGTALFSILFIIFMIADLLYFEIDPKFIYNCNKLTGKKLSWETIKTVPGFSGFSSETSYYFPRPITKDYVDFYKEVHSRCKDVTDDCVNQLRQGDHPKIQKNILIIFAKNDYMGDPTWLCRIDIENDVMKASAGWNHAD
jgi:hypothetical protein